MPRRQKQSNKVAEFIELPQADAPPEEIAAIAGYITD